MAKKKLAILGLDGVDWGTINNKEEFAWFGTQIEDDNMGPLFIDTIAHTNPSWTLAFTGVDVANEKGIKGFKGMENGEPHWYTSDDVPAPFIWDHLEAEGYDVVRTNWLGMDHKFDGDIKYDCEYLDAEIENQERTMFDSKPDEINEVMHKEWGELCTVAQNQRPDALISYFHGPDLAGHVLRGGPESPPGEMDELIENYHNVEDLTKEMTEKLTNLGYDVLYLSDHGLPDGVTRHKNESICTHKGTGVIGSPTINFDYPLKMSDVHPFLVYYFDLSNDPDIEEKDHSMSEDEVEYVEEQLKGLGYL